MINKNDVDAYRSIKAPDSLRDRVTKSAAEMSKPKKPIALYKRITAFAACIAIIVVAIGASVYSLNFTTEIYSGNDSFIAAKASRTFISPLSVAVYAHSKTEVSVSNGTIEIYDEKTDELIFSGSNGCFSGSVRILWYTNSENNMSDGEMTISNIAKEKIFKAETDIHGNSVLIEKTKEETKIK